MIDDDAALREKYRDVGSLNSLFGAKSQEEFQRVKRAAGAFAMLIVLIAGLILMVSFVPALSDITLPLIGLLFLIGGCVSAGIAGIPLKRRLAIIGGSVAGIAPGILLILLAMSVKFIISNGGIMDTILYYTSGAILAASPFAAILLIYALVLLLELFVGSSSAKAFLVMPIIAPLSDLIGVTRRRRCLLSASETGFPT